MQRIEEDLKSIRDDAIYITNGYLSNFTISEGYIYFGIDSDNQEKDLKIVYKKSLGNKYDNKELVTINTNSKYKDGSGMYKNEFEISIPN